MPIRALPDRAEPQLRLSSSLLSNTASKAKHEIASREATTAQGWKGIWTDLLIANKHHVWCSFLAFGFNTCETKHLSLSHFHISSSTQAPRSCCWWQKVSARPKGKRVFLAQKNRAREKHDRTKASPSLHRHGKASASNVPWSGSSRTHSSASPQAQCCLHSSAQGQLHGNGSSHLKAKFGRKQKAPLLPAGLPAPLALHHLEAEDNYSETNTEGKQHSDRAVPF